MQFVPWIFLSQECYWNSYWNQTPLGKKKLLLNLDKLLLFLLFWFCSEFQFIQQEILFFKDSYLYYNHIGYFKIDSSNLLLNKTTFFFLIISVMVIMNVIFLVF